MVCRQSCANRVIGKSQQACWLGVALFALLFMSPAAVVAGTHQLGDVTAYAHDGGTLTLECGDARVRLDAITDHVVRVRLAPQGEFARDFSWAVEERAPKAAFTKVFTDDDTLLFKTAYVSVVVRRKPCRISMMDELGKALVVDDPEHGITWEDANADGDTPFRVWQEFPDGVSVFGLGEKTGGMHRENRAWHMWNTDEGAYGATSDPIYADVPFFIAADGKRYYGVFLDNTWRASFDIGQSRRNRLSFGADGGPLDYYVIAGPHPADVIHRYTELTGRMPLPPKWAIGYHQCRHSYAPEARVREVADTFREKRIPCDVLYFDIYYMNGYRCFTWDPERFPDPAGMMNDLHAQGFHTIAIIDPGIKNEDGYPVYDTGSAIDAWVKRPDGEPYVGRVWPGDCVFPDFTADRVRDWWAGLYPKFIGDSGLDGVWNDMNEPANFAGPNKTVPLDLRHDYAGESASHRAAHNVYGMQMARATRDGLGRARPGDRPFTLTRANYAGGQRYAAIWTGDNISSWEHMSMSIAMSLGCGISGMPFVGPDIGGFVGGATPELYARWIAFGALFPFSRTHTSSNNPDQEPWAFGLRVEKVARTSIERRYRWMPYLYTVFEEATRTGLPIMRPIWLQDPGYEGWKLDTAFFIGSDVFVSPKLTPGEDANWVELPHGVWFDGNTGDLYGGGRWYPFDGSLETLPHFFRAGAIVPMQSVVQSTAEAASEPLILDVWPWGESAGTLYEDDGKTLAHKDGAYRRTLFHCGADDVRIAFDIGASEGSYTTDAPPPLVRIHHVQGDVQVVAFESAASSGDAKRANKSVDSADALTPGSFHFDAATGVLMARVLKPLGDAQGLEVTLGPGAADASEPIVLHFDGKANELGRPRGATNVAYDEDGAHFTMRATGPARLTLPRLNVPLDALPVFTLRAATQHAKKVLVRYATDVDPTRTMQGIEMGLSPDGELHDYSVDLRSAAGENHGTVYWMELEFTDGISLGETIHVSRATFEPK
ncbi:MAG: DUF4968 domain-containing protein [Phycisphaerales bacterium]|nr:DUF4968 domain-containing protein [Phycisphaerales bacterium]